MQIYQFRITAQPNASAITGNIHPEYHTSFSAASRLEAIARYNQERQAAHTSRQITLYGPSGNRIREARGLA
jgi:hypothetical protein